MKLPLMATHSPMPETWVVSRSFSTDQVCRATAEADMIYCCMCRMTMDGQAWRAAMGILNTTWMLNPKDTPFESLRLTLEKMSLSDLLCSVSASLENEKAKPLGHLIEMRDTLDISNTSLDELKAIRNIGDKTSRFFLVKTAQFIDYAILEACSIRYMRRHCSGLIPHRDDICGDEYVRVEKMFRDQVAEPMGVSMREAHVIVWNLHHGLGGYSSSPSRIAIEIQRGMLVPTLDWSEAA